MGRRGRRVAMERFSAEEMVERYVKVYESLR
jgi:glycosyltransferase involved in cell wall biosynthesis